MSEHTRTSTPYGPDFCAECSAKIGEWVSWPCDARVTAARLAKNRADVEARYQEHLRLGPQRCGCGMCHRTRATQLETNDRSPAMTSHENNEAGDVRGSVIDDRFHLAATWDEDAKADAGLPWLTKCGQHRPPSTEMRPPGAYDAESCATCFEGWVMEDGSDL